MAAPSQTVSQRAPFRLWETPPHIQTNAGAEPDLMPGSMCPQPSASLTPFKPSGLSTTGAKASIHLPPDILNTSNKTSPTCFPHKSGATFCGLCMVKGHFLLQSPVDQCFYKIQRVINKGNKQGHVKHNSKFPSFNRL